MIRKIVHWYYKRLLKKLAAQNAPATKKQLIADFELRAIQSINQSTEAEKAMLSLSTGALELIDPN